MCQIGDGNVSKCLTSGLLGVNIEVLSLKEVYVMSKKGNNSKKNTVVWIMGFIVFSLMVSSIVGVFWFLFHDVPVKNKETVSAEKHIVEVIPTTNIMYMIDLVHNGKISAAYFHNENNGKLGVELVEYINKDKSVKDRVYAATGVSSISLEKIHEEVVKNKVPFYWVATLQYPQKTPDLSFYQVATLFIMGVFNFIFSNFLMIVSILISIAILYSFLGNGAKPYDIAQPEDISGDMDDLIGMEDIKTEVLQIADIYNNQELYSKHGIKRPFNIMFSGPAGTGKTKLASYLAKKLELPILFASAANLETGFVAGGAKNLKRIQKEAIALKRCIVFIDEAQTLFMKRGQATVSQSKWADDTPNAFLAILDGVKTVDDAEIIWILASNFDDGNMEMDEAMSRRFQMKINFRLPNHSERKELLSAMLKKKDGELLAEDLNLDYMAEVTSGLAPAIIETIVEKASMLAIQDEMDRKNSSVYDLAEKVSTGEIEYDHAKEMIGKLETPTAKITNDILFKAFERTVIGMTDRETTGEKAEKRKIIAYHEMGHFIVKFHQVMEKTGGNIQEATKLIPVLKISTEAISKSNALGYVLSKQEDVPLYKRDELEDEICNLYGGVASEEVFFGESNISTGSSNDIERATAILHQMIMTLNMYSNSKINYAKLNNVMEIDNNKKQAELEEKSAELYNKTLDIIRTHKDLIEYIAPILIEKFVIDIMEMMSIIEKFYQNKHYTASQEWFNTQKSMLDN